MSGSGHYVSRAGNDETLDLRRTSDFQAALLGMAGHDLRPPLRSYKAPMNGWAVASRIPPRRPA
jgi:hypothetical protein